ncbi:hypothetical protein E4U13_004867 [Claviceps humidiphila]|uniref:Uncharacterized protein n=1 Tax=Claviceps humidiphila TaxID=1294629 RepID=A0A9P7QAJ3_9HYPO|nr:hypothetical protein E4U13_004867 [Claviceps humidiphila]
MLSAWRYDVHTKEVPVSRSYDAPRGRSSKVQALAVLVTPPLDVPAPAAGSRVSRASTPSVRSRSHNLDGGLWDAPP